MAVCEDSHTFLFRIVNINLQIKIMKYAKLNSKNKLGLFT